MECHGGDYPRATIIIGQETVSIQPKPANRGGVTFLLADLLVKSAHVSASYWLHKNICLRADYKSGTIQQGLLRFGAHAVTVGAAGPYGNRFAWDSDLVVSQTETYPRKAAFKGNIHYKIGKGLKITIGGGAFLRGTMNYGTDLSELGQTAIGLEKEDSSLLPDLFRRLRDSRYGYLHTTLTYDYAF